MAKSARTMKKEVDLKEANAAVFYKGFRAMGSASWRRTALRILNDEAILENLYDYFQIQEAEKEKRPTFLWGN